MWVCGDEERMTALSMREVDGQYGHVTRFSDVPTARFTAMASAAPRVRVGDGVRSIDDSLGSPVRHLYRHRCDRPRHALFAGLGPAGDATGLGRPRADHPDLDAVLGRI